MIENNTIQNNDGAGIFVGAGNASGTTACGTTASTG